MYSLYRAWLSLGPCPIPPIPHPTSSQPALTNGAPDVTLQVGLNMTQFSAHKTVLSAHSGFFKAALINHNTSDSAPIAVPNVNVDEFSSLLTFMYTGYLDLNLANIYNILLATHILHMPRALEICRSFLMQQQQQQPSTSSINFNHPPIIKPIPNRKQPLNPAQQQIFAPIVSNLEKSEVTPFKSVMQQAKIVQKPTTPPTQNATTTAIKPPKKKKSSTSSSTTTTTTTLPTSKEESSSHSNETNKVIVDIACCDGPVRFHRIINKNYGQQSTNDNFEPSTSNQDEINRNAAMNKVMNENIRDQQKNDEVPPSTNTNTEMFTCLYCNHTFKSQYCYQKHARRHLNPVTLDKTSPSTSSAAPIQQQRPVSPKEKREVKLLDMNVQYYPCKTCGSKFPSYYFVHKHRKMCHADEMENEKQQQVATNVQEVEQEDKQCTNSSSSSSQIDVE